MTLSPKSAALLRDVVKAIVDSGYAVPIELYPNHVSRREQIEVLSNDPRIFNRAYRSEMVLYVMATYGVTNVNARGLLFKARRAARDRKRLTGMV